MCLDVVFCLEFVKVLDLWLSGIPKLPPRFGNLLERHAELSVQKQNHHSSRVFLRGVTQGMLYCSSSEFWQHMWTGVYQRGSSVTLSPGFLLRGAVCLACARISDFRNKMNNRSEEVSYFAVVPFILKAYYDSFFVIVYLFNSMKFKML